MSLKSCTYSNLRFPPYYGYSLCYGKHSFDSKSIVWEKLKAYGNKAKRSAKQQRPDLLILFWLASRRSDRAKWLRQNKNNKKLQC